MNATIINADCLDALRDMPDASVDAVVTDPPYGLSNTRPDQVAETITRWASGDREYLPTGRGFMGHEWDGFVPPVAVWDECLRVLKPGGHLLAFAGSRTQDLMGLAVRLAGFEIRDSVAWLYGSGFPKSLDVSKAIDKAAGAEREVVGQKITGNAKKKTSRTGEFADGKHGGQQVVDVTRAATDAARQWEGWGTALKPAMEPVIWAQKPFNVVPFGGEVNQLHHMIGALLWLSLSPAKRAELLSPSSRPAPHEATCVSARANAGIAQSLDASGETGTFSSPAAASTSWSIATSWSSILGALSGKTKTCTTSTRSSTTTALRTLNSLLAPLTSPTTMPACECLTCGQQRNATSADATSSDDWSNWMHTLNASVPETAIEPIGRAVASALADIAASVSDDPEAGSSATSTATPTTAGNERGGAIDHIILARKPMDGRTVAANVLEHGTGALNIDGSRVGGPSGRWPANVVLDESQAAELDRQSGVSVSRIGRPRGAAAGDGWGMTKTGAEYADQGGASRFFHVIEQDVPFIYCAKAPKKERPVVDGISHPTTKPLKLMRLLVRMVTPPGGTVLDPFAGSGTTLEAAILEGFNAVGIEREADYLPLIQARIERAQTNTTKAPTQGAFSFGEDAA